MSIERNFDISLVASLALKEKQIQQNYRPIIAVHKWFARRPGTLFRGLLLSEFSGRQLNEEYFNTQDLSGKVVADPFMGGGTPLIEANRIGCDVVGFDINPMSAWIVREEVEDLDVAAYRKTARDMVSALEGELGDLYRTDCPKFGDANVPVKYFLWVKTIRCEDCDHEIDLFPGYLVADDTRHPRNVLVCHQCGELNEVADLKAPQCCAACNAQLKLAGPAKRNRCGCPACGAENRFPRPDQGPLGHRLFAMEYVNPARRGDHKGRFFKRPDAKDLARAAKAAKLLADLQPRFIPDDRIPAGDETSRLHRWGYSEYRQLFNPRQLLGLELSCRAIEAMKDARIQRALATNLSDLLRYQNMLCRYDTMALKSLDVFSVHGFPVGLVQCESNLLGIVSESGTNVGSGGWTNIIEKYAKAKAYCAAPFEIQHQNGRNVRVPVKGEWIGIRRKGAKARKVDIRCVSATATPLPRGSVDAVFTDPPYFGNVQYAELMDFCFAWLRRLVGGDADGFGRDTTRNPDELTVNQTEGRDLAHFTEGLASVYTHMAEALKPGAPLAFTYHHNKLEAYAAIAVAILDAGLTCSASLPCPAEMGGSIHISGTGSSIIDTVFVCRTSGQTDQRKLFTSAAELVRIVRDDLARLRVAGVKPTAGDIRCIVFGHMTRMAIWQLRPEWDRSQATADKLAAISKAVGALGHWKLIVETLSAPDEVKRQQTAANVPLFYEDERHAVAF